MPSIFICTRKLYSSVFHKSRHLQPESQIKGAPWCIASWMVNFNEITNDVIAYNGHKLNHLFYKHHTKVRNPISFTTDLGYTTVIKTIWSRDLARCEKHTRYASILLGFVVYIYNQGVITITHKNIICTWLDMTCVLGWRIADRPYIYSNNVYLDNIG